MKAQFLFICLLFFCSFQLLAQHQEKAPQIDPINPPDWVQLLYSPSPDPQMVITAYQNYYKSHPFVKNGHTQYYKHWLRNLSRDVSGLFSGAITWKEIQLQEAAYLARSQTGINTESPTSNWECVGPIDFDQEANERSYAPGAAHVYTVEKAASNANVLYAGTATAGLFKTIDNGLTWNLVTRDLMVNSIRAIEIDASNENIVYFGGAGALYKTTDGGATWNIIGDPTFQATSHSINDIVAYPGSSSIFFICADDGLFRSTDAGANWTKLKGGEFQELEFHPTNSNIVYCIKQPDIRTEFYKSTDGGLTWTLKPNGWPGVASFTSHTFEGFKMNGATSDYVSFATNPQLGNGTNEDFTIEMRIKTNGWSSDPAIFSNKNWNNGYNKGFVLAGKSNGSEWKFNIADGSSRIDIDGGTINDNEWHHLVITYDANGTKSLYQDGILVGSSTTNISTNTNNAHLLALGQDGTLGYSAGMPFEVNEIRVWNTVLSAATINNWKCTEADNTHPNFASLIHHWKIDEGSGTILNEAIASNTGTATGSNAWTASNNMTCLTTNLTGTDEQKRTEIAVSLDDSTVVYALATGADNGGSGLYGIYKSTNEGETWTFNCCGAQPAGVPAAVTNINMMGWQDNGSDDGGQYYYDLALAIAPNDADKVHVGGVNHWLSSDGGNNFTCPAKWSHPEKPEYVHADIHDIRYFGTELWIACDGGLFYSADGGSNITRRMVGIEGTDFWGFGAGFSDGEVILGGTYHNGTLLKDNNVYNNGWLSTRGGDNYRGFVNFADNKIVYDDGGKRRLSGDRTQNFEEFSFAQKPNATYVVGESSSIEFDPTNPNILYSGKDEMIWKSTDGGFSFNLLYDFGAGHMLGEIRVAWTDPSTIYAATFGSSDKVWRSNNGGLTWTDITPGSNAVPYSITVSGTGADTLWAARTVSWTSQGTLNGNKVYKSTDGGTSWIEISTPALDGEYLTNILHQRGTNGGVYLGTRRAVYYKNDAMSDWVLFNNNLPVSTFSTRLVPNYGDEKVFNGSNRSVYKVDFYEHSTPIAQIAVEQTDILCTGDVVQFIDHSAVLKTGTYNWSFPGGNPATSTSKNPIVTYAMTGSYDVSLTVTDANGSHSQTLTNFIQVLHNCEPDTNPGSALLTDGTNSSYAIGEDNENLDFGATTDFSITAWFKTTSTTSDGVLIAKKDWDSGGNNGWVIALSSGKFWVNVGDGSNRIDIEPNNLVNDGAWHHIAASFDRDGMAKLYLDGVEIGAQDMTHIGDIDNSKIFSIGVDDELDYPLAAEIDEVCIFDKVLSLAEVRLQKHLTKSIGTANLITYLQFNEASGAVFDRIGGGNHCVISGATRVVSTAPFGGGLSEQMPLSTGLFEYDFPTLGATLFFSDCEAPNGEVVIARLDLVPDSLPNGNAHAGNYWILSGYEGAVSFPTLDSIKLTPFDLNFTTNLNAVEDAILFTRTANEHMNNWQAKARATQLFGNTLRYPRSATINGSCQIFLTDGGTNFDEIDPGKFCEVDTIPGYTLQTFGSGDWVQTPDLNFTTDTLTITAWVKPNGIQSEYAGVLFNDDVSAGLNFREDNNTLGYHWPGGAWWWDSGLEVPADEWSHVALVATPNNLTVYLNGVGVTHNTSLDPVTFGSMKVGSYKGWGSRNYNGEIEELCMWRRALNQADIRALLHLTKEDLVGVDSTLHLYLQFNEVNGEVIDKSGNSYHAALVGNATRTISNAPVASGSSQKMEITSGGVAHFENTGLKLGFPNTGTYPNGDIQTYRLHLPPDQKPTADTLLSNHYWIIRNFGTNATFSALDHIIFENTSPISAQTENAPHLFGLYKRNSNAFGNTWGSNLGNAETVTTTGNNQGAIEFGAATNLTDFSQFAIADSRGVRLNLKVFLQGAYDGGLMNDALRSNYYLPVKEPYSSLNFNHFNGGGGEIISALIFNTLGNDAIVDWIFVELRDKNDATQVHYTRAALLQRDGDIVELDGVSPVFFQQAVPDNYYIAVRHRNHLGAMTAGSYALNSIVTNIDFTSAATPIYGTNGLVDLGASTLGLWQGDVTQDGIIKYNGKDNDRVQLLHQVGYSNPNNVLTGYYIYDVNLDGMVKYYGVNNDREAILLNLGASTMNAVRVGQLPE